MGMGLKRYLMFVAMVSVTIMACNGPAQGLDLASGGEMRAAIHYKSGSEEQTQKAAEELARVFSEMTGDEVTAQAVAGPGEVGDGPAILVGALAEEAGLTMNEQSPSQAGFRYQVNGDRVLLVGESPRGVYVGAHDLMRRLGCGWYAPGDVGEVIPAKQDVALPDDLDHSEVSDSVSRRFWYGGGGARGRPDDAWIDRHDAQNAAGSWRHAYHGLVSSDLFEEHPEYFAMRPDGTRTTHQLNTTNEDVIRIAAESLNKAMNERPEQHVFAAGPNDGGGLCVCEDCMELRTEGYLEPSSGNLNASSQVFKFAADVAARTSEQHPDKYLGVYVYSDYSRVPKKIEKVSPNVFPMIGPIRRCRLHGPGNPGCEWNQLLAEEIQAWSKLSDGKMGFYPYNYNLADTMLPFSKITPYKQYQDAIEKANITQLAWTHESMDSWAVYAPHHYLSVRMSWNSRLDIDATMDRYFNGFYGAAAEPMKRYWMRIDEAYASADHHTGSQYALHHIWTPELLSASRQAINEAKKLASNEREQEAVAMAEAGLRNAELFMAAWNALGNFEFQKAAQIEDRLEQHITQHANNAHQPNWFHKQYAYGYHNRFVAGTIRAGAKIMENGGEIVAKLPEQWQFTTDEQGVGADEGWYEPGFDASDWRTVGTFTQSWSDIGIGMQGFYHGDVWYRTTFNVPEDAQGEDLRLWFGGFDHNVDVYLNGEHLGEKTGFMRPKEYEGIASALKFGEENVIAVRCNSGGLAELGTGGIMMPVMIYAAPEGEGEAGEEGEGEDGTEYQM